jgi:hypothetical protein
MSEQGKKIDIKALTQQIKGSSLKGTDIFKGNTIEKEPVIAPIEETKPKSEVQEPEKKVTPEPEKAVTSEKEKEIVQEKPKQQKKEAPKPKKESFSELLDRVELEGEKYSIGKRQIYVDENIHEVFQYIKKNGKVNISKLASYLLEQFIIDHMDEIANLQKEKKNRYLT